MRQTDNTVNQVLFRMAMIIVPTLLALLLSVLSYFGVRHMDKFDSQTVRVESIDLKLSGFMYQQAEMLNEQAKVKKNIETLQTGQDIAKTDIIMIKHELKVFNKYMLEDCDWKNFYAEQMNWKRHGCSK